MIDSVFRKSKSYYSQVLLEECKYVVKEKNISKYIIDDIENSSDFDRENSDEENFAKETPDEGTYDEENSDEENSNKETSDKENFFFYFRNDKQLLSKKQGKASKKSTWKVPKSF